MLVGHDIAVLTDNKAGTKSTLYVFLVSSATKELTEKGIPVADEVFYVKNRPNEKQLLDAARFAGKFL